MTQEVVADKKPVYKAKLVTPIIHTSSRKKLILVNSQSPGDILMLTAAVRDLHKAHPGKYITDVRTSCIELWQNNPYITNLNNATDASVIQCHYPLINMSNQRPIHFIYGFSNYIERQLNVRIPVTAYRGDIHMSVKEAVDPPQISGKYWLVFAGGKKDFTCKWYYTGYYQEVVNRLKGKIHFVQCGQDNSSHWHPPLENVTNLVGKTSLRDIIKLMYHAEGVLCPVTFAMHLAAAVPIKPGYPKLKPCVVISGGREPIHWEYYPGHQMLHTIGALSCCETGGCWKSRCQPINDNDEKDKINLCENPVQVTPDLRIPKCMMMITPDKVVSAIETYYDGGILKY